jgi:hypothetical protein
MKRIVYPLLAGCILFASPCLAMDGKALLQLCDLYENPDKGKDLPAAKVLRNASQCETIVETIADTAVLYETFIYLDEPKMFSCFPEDLELEQKIKVVHTYLAANPERLHENGVCLVLCAFAQYYPCPETIIRD